MFCISLNCFSIIVWPKMEIIDNSIPGRESVREREREREKWSESLIAIYSALKCDESVYAAEEILGLDQSYGIHVWIEVNNTKSLIK
jgi:hypothetical protein